MEGEQRGLPGPSGQLPWAQLDPVRGRPGHHPATCPQASTAGEKPMAPGAGALGASGAVPHAITTAESPTPGPPQLPSKYLLKE